MWAFLTRQQFSLNVTAHDLARTPGPTTVSADHSSTARSLSVYCRACSKGVSSPLSLLSLLGLIINCRGRTCTCWFIKERRLHENPEQRPTRYTALAAAPRKTPPWGRALRDPVSLRSVGHRIFSSRDLVAVARRRPPRSPSGLTALSLPRGGIAAAGMAHRWRSLDAARRIMRT